VNTSVSELDIEQPGAALAYLRRTGLLGRGETAEASVLPGGVSSRVVLVRTERASWVLKQALARLRVPVPWFSDPLRVHREASALRWWAELAPGAAPDLVFEDREQGLVCMTAVPEPHGNWKSMLLAGELEREHVDRFAAVLALVHARSAERLAELAGELDDRTYFRTLRLEPYYLYSADQVPEAAGFLRTLVDDTLRVRETLVHGDYSPKNVLVHEGRLVVVDHEVSHVGDPAFDLGFAGAHLLSKAHHLTDERAAFLDAALRFWSEYVRAADGCAWLEGVERRAVRHQLACLLARVAGRSQLEYLTPAEKERQLGLVLAVLRSPPSTIAALVKRWGEGLS
jgi:5-methylthioribose kinase